MLVRLLRNKILPFNINGKDTINIIACIILQLPKVLDTRVAHDYIESTELAHDGFEHGLDFAFFRHVCLDGYGFDALSSDLLSYGLGGRGRGDVVDGDVGALGGEF
jgi:hypothetical protein